MDENVIKYVLKVFICVFILFALVVFVHSSGLQLNADDVHKQLIQVVTIDSS